MATKAITLRGLPSRPAAQSLIDAMKLCEAEANRWSGHDEKTAAHWQKVAADLHLLDVGNALDRAVQVTKHLREKELRAEQIPQGFMDFRMRNTEVAHPEPLQVSRPAASREQAPLDELANAERELTRADARILQLEGAIQDVLTAYGDDGWARSEMCRRLRKALETIPFESRSPDGDGRRIEGTDEDEGNQPTLVSERRNAARGVGCEGQPPSESLSVSILWQTRGESGQECQSSADTTLPARQQVGTMPHPTTGAPMPVYADVYPVAPADAPAPAAPRSARNEAETVTQEMNCDDWKIAEYLTSRLKGGLDDYQQTAFLAEFLRAKALFAARPSPWPPAQTFLEFAKQRVDQYRIDGWEQLGDAVWNFAHEAIHEGFITTRGSPWPPAWQPMETAPKDGSAILGYGRHTGSPPDAQHGVKAGDHWWAIMLWDVWRNPDASGWGERSLWVFAKDGTPTWSHPTGWLPLPDPPVDGKSL